MKFVISECSGCSATGVYQGMCEGPGIAVVCLLCKGTGQTKMTYKPFVKRKVRKGVKIVHRSAGTFIAGPIGPTGEGIPYSEFLKGKMTVKP